MIPFPPIDPIAFELGPLAVRWYGLSYLAGISIGWWLLHRRATGGGAGWAAEEVSDLVFYAAIGAVLGGRIGYGIFYNFDEYLRSPLSLFAVWRGGMSFHGGAIGMVAALMWFARRTHKPFFAISDFILPVVPIGLGLGRIANFINQELWGAPTNLPWAVLFTTPAAGGIARHPSQLYEAGLEGLLLFVILNVLRRQRLPQGTLSGVFLLGYGVCRFLVEFVREPDAQIGYLWQGWVTMGQVLSVPMVLAGSIIMIWAGRTSRASPTG